LIEYFEDDFPDLIPENIRILAEFQKISYLVAWIEENHPEL